MKGYSASEYQRGYAAGRRFSERQIQELLCKVEALKGGLVALAELTSERRLSEPVSVERKSAPDP